MRGLLSGFSFTDAAIDASIAGGFGFGETFDSDVLTAQAETVYGRAALWKAAIALALLVVVSIFAADWLSFSSGTLRLGVTGLSRAGKTVFITSAVQNLLAMADGKGALPISLLSNLISAAVARGVSFLKDKMGQKIFADGFRIHEDPFVPNFGKPGKGEPLVPGMIIAIEPMLTLGTHDVIETRDGYTLKTADSSIAAHFEHTVLITDTGYEILTQI